MRCVFPIVVLTATVSIAGKYAECMGVAQVLRMLLEEHKDVPWDA